MNDRSHIKSRVTTKYEWFLLTVSLMTSTQPRGFVRPELSHLLEDI